MNGNLVREATFKQVIDKIYTDDEGRDIYPSLDDFRIQRVLGSGAYATVKLAVHERSKKKFALKIYPAQKLQDTLKKKAVEQEIFCM